VSPGGKPLGGLVPIADDHGARSRNYELRK
jgi:hypothetical protein